MGFAIDAYLCSLTRRHINRWNGNFLAKMGATPLVRVLTNPLGEQELLEGLKQLLDGEQKAKVGASARRSTILDWTVSLVMIVLLNMLASTFASFTQLLASKSF